MASTSGVGIGTSTNRYGGTALIPACHHGHLENVKVLLATDIDVNHVNRLGWTALLEAVPVDTPAGLRDRALLEFLYGTGANGKTVFKGTVLQEPGETDYVIDPLPAGTYTFICSIHPIPAMTGTLTVK